MNVINQKLDPQPPKSQIESFSARNILAVLVWPILIFLYSRQDWWKGFLKPFATKEQALLYEQSSLLSLFADHLFIVGIATILIIIVAIPIAIFVTRPAGEAFLPLAQNLTTITQTLPPMAVLFLFLPVLGFGPNVVIFSMFLFGLLPTLQATLTGIKAVDIQTLDAANGIGLSSAQILWQVELPLALPSILSGLRTSILLIIATSALAPMVGAESLGSPIIVGFGINSTSQILQGAIAVALLSIVANFSLRTLEKYLTRWRLNSN